MTRSVDHSLLLSNFVHIRVVPKTSLVYSNFYIFSISLLNFIDGNELLSFWIVASGYDQHPMSIVFCRFLRIRQKNRQVRNKNRQMQSFVESKNVTSVRHDHLRERNGRFLYNSTDVFLAFYGRVVAHSA